MPWFSSPDKREFGAQLEAQAAKLLECHGCEIVEKNYQCKLGEIDIIAKDRESLVFIEVRYRQQSAFGGASASVNATKQRKLALTAAHYLQQNNLTNKAACRFDVFAMQGPLENLRYNWIKHAFDAPF